MFDRQPSNRLAANIFSIEIKTPFHHL